MRTLALVTSLAATLGLVASCQRTADAPDQQWTQVQSRLWIERVPRDARDMIHQIVFLDDDRAGQIGVRLHGSSYRRLFDAFSWSRRGSALKMLLLQDERTTDARFRAWQCAGEAPEPFELCLELREGPRVRSYFSRKDWIIRDLNDVDLLLSEIAAQLGVQQHSPVR